MYPERAVTNHTVFCGPWFVTRRTRQIAAWVLLLSVVLAPAGCRRSARRQEPNAPTTKSEPNKLAAPTEPNAVTSDQVDLFDGRTLGQWKVTDFGGQGEVSVKDGAIYMEMGNDMTGITWTGPVVRMSYEITLEAKRVKGNDFFCGLTFPVGDKPCSLILGGWGGSVCGLSTIDYYDAANNETTKIISFEKDRWYRIRLCVLPNRIQAWLDDQQQPLVDIDTTGRKIGIRSEVDLSQPLGISTWQTAGAVRNIRLKKLAD